MGDEKLKPICENKNGKGYKDAIVCPRCGYEIVGLSKVLDFINEEIIYETQYDDYVCPECDKYFDFNVESCECGDYLDEGDKQAGREILSIETWVWTPDTDEEVQNV